MPFDWTETGLLVLTFGLGTLTALWPMAPRYPALAAAAVGGVMMGLASTPGPGPLQATLVTLFGSVLGVAALSLYAIGGFGWLHEKGCTQWQWTRGWAAIAFRVGAAWATAIAALGLALSAAGTR